MKFQKKLITNDSFRDLEYNPCDLNLKYIFYFNVFIEVKTLLHTSIIIIYSIIFYLDPLEGLDDLLLELLLRGDLDLRDR